MALHLSLDFLGIFRGTVLQKAIDSLFDKVHASLNPKKIQFMENLSKALRVGFAPTKDYGAFGHEIAELDNAALEKKRVEIRYKALSTDEETKRTVDPYQIWAMNGSFYLIGYCHLRKTMRTFSLDRIKNLKVLDETFEQPADFKHEEFQQSAFRVMTGIAETIKIRFKGRAVQVVKERIYHSSQHIEDHEDGSITLSLEVAVNYEIISWILGFGPKATVLEPESLKKRIMSDLAATLKGYESEPAET